MSSSLKYSTLRAYLYSMPPFDIIFSVLSFSVLLLNYYVRSLKIENERTVCLELVDLTDISVEEENWDFNISQKLCSGVWTGVEAISQMSLIPILHSIWHLSSFIKTLILVSKGKPPPPRVLLNPNSWCILLHGVKLYSSVTTTLLC